MSVYVVDSNFFIQAHRASYPLDVATSFWTKLIQLADEGKMISIDKVKHEIFKNEDDLKQWCEINLTDNFFKDTTTVISSYAQVAAWAAWFTFVRLYFKSTIRQNPSTGTLDSYYRIVESYRNVFTLRTLRTFLLSALCVKKSEMFLFFHGLRKRLWK
jgi:hypothetical protein